MNKTGLKSNILTHKLFPPRSNTIFFLRLYIHYTQNDVDLRLTSYHSTFQPISLRYYYTAEIQHPIREDFQKFKLI